MVTPRDSTADVNAAYTRPFRIRRPPRHSDSVWLLSLIRRCARPFVASPSACSGPLGPFGPPLSEGQGSTVGGSDGRPGRPPEPVGVSVEPPAPVEPVGPPGPLGPLEPVVPVPPVVPVDPVVPVGPVEPVG